MRMEFRRRIHKAMAIVLVVLCIMPIHYMESWAEPLTDSSYVDMEYEVAPQDVVYLEAKQAEAKATQILVTFNPNGGTVNPTSRTVTVGQTFGGAFPTPTRPEYIFEGWFTAVTGGTRIRGTDTVASDVDMTLFARWRSSNTIVVTFNPNGGTVSPTSRTVTVGQTFGGAFPTPSRPGYIFEGWFTAVNGGTRIRGTDTVTATANKTIFARWRGQNTIVVTFNPNGGTVNPTSRTVTIGQTFGGAFPTPTRAGHVFEGWFTAVNGGTRIRGTDTVTQTTNMTIFARWRELNTIVVTFDPSGGSVSPTSRTVEVGQTFGGAFPTPIRPGHVFEGWFTAGGTRVRGTDTVTSNVDMTLFARWRLANLTVTFNSNGGSQPNPASVTVTHTGTYGTLPIVTRHGHTFAGWWTHISGGTQVFPTTQVTATKNHTLYARWTPIQVAVVFITNGGKPLPPAQLVNYGSPYGTLPAVSRAGYTFGGWFTAMHGGSQVHPETIVNTMFDHMLFARWAPDSRAFEEEVLRLVNIERAKVGAPPLRKEAPLSMAARTRAREQEILFSHTRPDGSSWLTVLLEYGVNFWSAGENLFVGPTTPEAAVRGWMNSPGHRENMLNPNFTRMGVGHHWSGDSQFVNHWAQLFAN